MMRRILGDARKKMKPIQSIYERAEEGMHVIKKHADTASYMVGSAIMAAELVEGSPKAVFAFLLFAAQNEYRRAIRSYSRPPAIPLRLTQGVATAFDYRDASFLVGNAFLASTGVALASTIHSVPAALFGAAMLAVGSRGAFIRHKVLTRRGVTPTQMRGLYFDKVSGLWDRAAKENNTGGGPSGRGYRRRPGRPYPF